ncbi:hypothetical protein B0J17DRAFT_632290 [Rhizoctonia solani]|nr:hypothetical protein B0J17DRAFT_632290 [Rhizoctonia solani]
MLVARHTTSLRCPPTRDRLTNYVTAKIVKGLLDLVVQTVTKFRDVTGRKLDKGMGKRELLVWRLPTGAVNWALGIFLRFRFYLGLEDDLRAKAKAKIEEHVGPMLLDILNSRNLARGSVSKILWSALLETLVEGYSTITGEQLIDKFKNHPNPLYRLKYRIYGKNVIQFTRIWNDALNAALPTAHNKSKEMDESQTIPSDPTKMHHHIFNEVFKAGCDAARKAAQAVVASTKSINSEQRNQMWDESWNAWEEVWTSAQDQCRVIAVNLIAEGLDEISRLASLGIMAEIQTEQPANATEIQSHNTCQVRSCGIQSVKAKN